MNSQQLFFSREILVFFLRTFERIVPSYSDFCLLINWLWIFRLEGSKSSLKIKICTDQIIFSRKSSLNQDKQPRGRKRTQIIKYDERLSNHQEQWNLNLGIL